MISRHAGGGPRVAIAVHTRPRPTRYTKFVAPSLSQAPLIFKVCMLASMIGSTIWVSVADSGVLRRMRANSPAAVGAYLQKSREVGMRRCGYG